MQDSKPKYDLEERTAKFGESVIILCRSLVHDFISKSIIDQLVRSGTSVGANYMEANGASSKKDFRNKISICKKEAQETKHWLRMLSTYFPNREVELKKITVEAQELTMIFQSIINKLNR